MRFISLKNFLLCCFLVLISGVAAYGQNYEVQLLIRISPANTSVPNQTGTLNLYANTTSSTTCTTSTSTCFRETYYGYETGTILSPKFYFDNLNHLYLKVEFNSTVYEVTLSDYYCSSHVGLTATSGGTGLSVWDELMVYENETLATAVPSVKVYEGGSYVTPGTNFCDGDVLQLNTNVSYGGVPGESYEWEVADEGSTTWTYFATTNPYLKTVTASEIIGSNSSLYGKNLRLRYKTTANCYTAVTSPEYTIVPIMPPASPPYSFDVTSISCDGTGGSVTITGGIGSHILRVYDPAASDLENDDPLDIKEINLPYTLDESVAFENDASKNITSLNSLSENKWFIDIEPNTEPVNTCANYSETVDLTPGISEFSSVYGLSRFCNGSGYLTLYVSSGFNVYNYYLYDDSYTQINSYLGSDQSSHTFQLSSSGTYSIKVTNECGQEVNVNSWSVSESSSSSVSVSSNVTPPVCFEGDGSVTLGITGIAPFTIQMTNDASSEVVRDETVNWDDTDSNLATARLDGIAPGTYTTVVTDNCGATNTVTLTVSDNSDVNTQFVVSDLEDLSVECLGETTSVTVDINDQGTAPYIYEMLDASNTVISSQESNDNPYTFTGIPEGDYSVLVTTSENCSDSKPFSVIFDEGTALTSSYVLNNKCNGVTAPTLNLTVTGGSEEYDIEILDTSNGEVLSTLTNQSSPIVTTVPWSKSVRVNVTDVCKGTSATPLEFTVDDEPSAITVTRKVEQITCNGNNDGSISLAVSGGVGPYTYEWSSSTDALFTHDGASKGSLTPATYTIDVTDFNGCVPPETIEITITEPATLTATPAPSDYNGFNISCYTGDDGSIDLTVSGGTSPYSYVWTNSEGTTVAKTKLITGLTTGTYNYTITDANGCKFPPSPASSVSYTLTEPAALQATVSSPVNADNYHVDCPGDSDGSIILSIEGGVAPYAIEFTKPDGTVDQYDDLSTLLQLDDSYLIDQLSAGDYSILIKDANYDFDNECTLTKNISLNEPLPIVLAPVLSHHNGFEVSCNNAEEGTINDGSITLRPRGGVGPYTFLWSKPDGTTATTQHLEDLIAGEYNLTITDAYDCSKDTILILEGPQPIVINPGINLLLHNGSHVSCPGESDGAIDLIPEGGNGVYTFNWSGPDGYTSTDEDISGLKAGIYSIQVTDENLCSVTETVTLVDPQALEITELAQTYADNYNDYGVQCNGYTNGGISLSVIGGTGDYRYEWTKDGDATFFKTTEDLTNESAGTYYITVYDVNDCNISDTIELTEPDPIQISNLTVTPPTCVDRGDAIVSLEISGGVRMDTDDYLVEIFKGNSTSPADFLVGKYMQNDTIADKEGELFGGNIEIEVLPTYTIKVTDKNDCYITKLLEIEDEPELQITLMDKKNPRCFDAFDGSISASAINGVPFTDKAEAYYKFHLEKTDDPTDGFPVEKQGTEVSFEGLHSGSYELWVEDDNGCKSAGTYYKDIEIVDPPQLKLTVEEYASPSCEKGGDGFILVTATGGDGDYTFKIAGYPEEETPGSEIISSSSMLYYNLSDSVDYIFTVTDGNYNDQNSELMKCSASIQESLPETPRFWTDFTVVHPECDEEEGTVSVTLKESTSSNTEDIALSAYADYTFTLYSDELKEEVYSSNVDITAPLTLPPNSYWLEGSKQIDAISVGGFTREAFTCPRPVGNFTIKESYKFDSLTLSSEPETCLGKGRIKATAYPYSSDIEYSIHPDSGWQKSPVFEGLADSSYTVYARYKKEDSCRFSNSILVEDQALVVSTDSITYNLCAGDASGIVRLSGIGDVEKFRLIHPDTTIESTTGLFTGLKSGSYLAEGFNADGCTSDPIPIEITEPDPLVIENVTSFQTACDDCKTGRISLDISGGTENIDGYEIKWYLNGTTLVEQPFGVGSYVAEITDDNNCTVRSETVDVTSLIGMTVDMDWFTEPTCTNEDGTLLLTVTKPDGLHSDYQAEDYIYTLDNEPFVPVDGKIEGIGLGRNYVLQVFDNLTGEQKVVEFEYDPYPEIAISPVTKTQTALNTDNGAAGLSVSGVGNDYTVTPSVNLTSLSEQTDFSGNLTGLVAASLEAGVVYIVTVTDNLSQCSLPFSFSVGNTGGHPVDVIVTDPFCGQENGEARVVVDYPGSYSVKWYDRDGVIYEQDVLTGFPDGAYGVIVTTDDDLITTKDFVMADEVSKVLNASDFNVAVTSDACGQKVGTAKVTNADGTSLTGYTISWIKNGEVLTSGSELIGNLEAGDDYQLYLEKDNGCAIKLPFSVDEYALPTIAKPTVYNSACGKAVGRATVVASGEVGDFTYHWKKVGGETWTEKDGIAEDLYAGSYEVFAKNTFGCKTLTENFTINDAPAMVLDYSVISEPTCHDSQNGKVSTIVTNGVEPFEYNWNYTGFGDSESAVNLGIGSHTVIVRDSVGCQDTLTFDLNGPEELTAVLRATNPSCLSGNDGSLAVDVFGGTEDYTIKYFSQSGTEVLADGLSDGSYYAVVTDANDCSFTTGTVEITDPDEIIISLLYANSPHCVGGYDGEAFFKVTGGSGEYTYKLDGTAEVSREVKGLPAGDYQLMVTDTESCSDTLDFTIQKAVPFNIEVVSKKEPSCYGSADGSIEVNVSGGNGDTLIVWNENTELEHFGASISGLTAGDYKVKVYDAEGCEDSLSITLTQPAPLKVAETHLYEPDCSGGDDGAIALIMEGGKPPYKVEWTSHTLPRVDSIYQISAGTYTAVIRDASGCSIDHTVTLSEPEPIEIVSVTKIQPLCAGNENGSISIEVSGGRGGYTVNWTNGQTGMEATGLSADTYGVLIEDSAGCRIYEEIQLDEPQVLGFSQEELFEPSCFGGFDGSVKVTIEGGTPPYSYVWSNGHDAAELVNISAGIYSVTATDENGCSISRTYQLGQPELLEITNVETKSPDCFQGSNGWAKVEVSGGTSPYTYLWDDGQTNARAINLSSGQHTYIVTDAKGCILEGSATIDKTSELEIIGVPSHTLACEGQVLTFDAGSEWDAFQWFKGNVLLSNNQSIELSEEGMYSVSVTSPLGCEVSMDFEIETSTDLMKADYIVTTTSFIGDTVVMVDLSMPAPDSIRWVYDRENENIWNVKENQVELQLKFKEEGAYTIGLYAYQSDCSDYFEKTIEVESNPEEDELSDILSRSAQKDFINLSVFPNPNNGEFEIEVKLEQEAPVSIEFIDLVGSRSIQKIEKSGDDFYKTKIRLNNVGRGLLLVRVVSGREVKVEKVFIN